MTDYEFKSALLEILKKYSELQSREIKNLHLGYIKSNQKYLIGDIISDSHNTIIVQSFSINPILKNGFPTGSYYGPILTKKLKPYKNKPCAYIHELNAKLIKKAKK